MISSFETLVLWYVVVVCSKKEFVSDVLLIFVLFCFFHFDV